MEGQSSNYYMSPEKFDPYSLLNYDAEILEVHPDRISVAIIGHSLTLDIPINLVYCENKPCDKDFLEPKLKLTVYSNRTDKFLVRAVMKNLKVIEGSVLKITEYHVIVSHLCGQIQIERSKVVGADLGLLPMDKVYLIKDADKYIKCILVKNQNLEVEHNQIQQNQSGSVRNQSSLRVASIENSVDLYSPDIQKKLAQRLLNNRPQHQVGQNLGDYDVSPQPFIGSKPEDNKSDYSNSQIRQQGYKPIPCDLIPPKIDPQVYEYSSQSKLNPLQSSSQSSFPPAKTDNQVYDYSSQPKLNPLQSSNQSGLPPVKIDPQVYDYTSQPKLNPLQSSSQSSFPPAKIDPQVYDCPPQPKLNPLQSSIKSDLPPAKINPQVSDCPPQSSHEKSQDMKQFSETLKLKEFQNQFETQRKVQANIKKNYVEYSKELATLSVTCLNLILEIGRQTNLGDITIPSMTKLYSDVLSLNLKNRLENVKDSDYTELNHLENTMKDIVKSNEFAGKTNICKECWKNKADLLLECGHRICRQDLNKIVAAYKNIQPANPNPKILRCVFCVRQINEKYLNTELNIFIDSSSQNLLSSLPDVSYPPQPNSQIPKLIHQLPKPDPQLSQPNPQIPKLNPQLPKPDPQLSQPNHQLPKPDPQLSQPNPQLSQPNPQLPKANPQVSQPNPQMFPGYSSIINSESISISQDLTCKICNTSKLDLDSDSHQCICKKCSIMLISTGITRCKFCSKQLKEFKSPNFCSSCNIEIVSSSIQIGLNCADHKLCLACIQKSLMNGGKCTTCSRELDEDEVQLLMECYAGCCISCKQYYFKQHLSQNSHCSCLICINCKKLYGSQVINICGCQDEPSQYAIICSYCNKGCDIDTSRQLVCSHIYCANCLKSHLTAITQEKLILTGCNECSTFLKASINLKPFIIPKEEAKRAIPSAESISCNICKSPSFPSDMTNLDCGHNFCKICLKDYIRYWLKSDVIGRFLECPCCNKTIKNVILKNQDEDFHVVYEKHLNQVLSMKVFCPKCYMLISPSTSVANCSNEDCKFKFCIKCVTDAHTGECNQEIMNCFISDISTIQKYVICIACGTPNFEDSRLGVFRNKCRNPDCNMMICDECGVFNCKTIVHGDYMHKPGCRKYKQYDRKQDENRLKCIDCKRLGRFCGV